MRGYRLVNIAAVAVLLAMPAAGQWSALEGGRFPIYTDTAESEARAVLAGLEMMAEGMEALWGPLPAGTPPVRVYLFRDAAGLRSMGARGLSKGFFQSGPDYDSIAALAGEADTARAVRHEYVHRVLSRTAGRLPPWLEEGLAELYSTLDFERGQWRVGMPVTAHIEYLSKAAWARFAELERMAEDDGLWDSAGGVLQYYGQSWALVHYLAVGSERAGRFRALMERVMRGEAADAALRAEYGMSGEELVRAARAQVEQRRVAVRQVAGATAHRSGGAPRWRPMGEDERAAVLSELAVATGARAGELEWLASLRKAAKGSPRARVGVGMMALRRGDKAEAEAELRAAVEAGVEEPSAWFELAMLIRDREGPTEEVARLLARTLELNPAHGEALYLTAIERQRSGRAVEAAALLERAVAALPRQFLFREALARLYFESGRHEEARVMAAAAQAAARSGDERAMAEGLLREFAQAGERAAPAERKPEVTTPRGWLEPRRDGTVRGVLAVVHCGDPVVFEVHTAEGVRRFRANPARLMVSGRAQDEPFSCGAQAGRAQVEARFRNPDLLVQLVFLTP